MSDRNWHLEQTNQRALALLPADWRQSGLPVLALALWGAQNLQVTMMDSDELDAIAERAANLMQVPDEQAMREMGYPDLPTLQGRTREEAALDLLLTLA